MKKNNLFLLAAISLVCLLFLETFVQAQEDTTVFSIHPYCFQRYSTSQKDKTEGLFLPQYSDIASNPESGITWSDWQKSDLSRERFLRLDTNSDEIITKEELDQDPFMGQSQLHRQDIEWIAKSCKKEFPDYKDRLQVLKNQYPKLKGENLDTRFDEVQYALNNNIYPKEALPLHLLSESGSEEIATKIYIQAKQGQAIRKSVDLGSFALLCMQDQKQEESFLLHIFGIATLGLVVFVTFISCKIF